MKVKQKSSNFFRGALVLMLFGFFSKIIGAIYRIPLTRIIGSEGMGIYQMVFPLYTIMLTISSSGLPSSISKLISENIAKNRFKQANKVLKLSFMLLIAFSFFCALLVCLLSGTIASFQGNSSARICYFGIAPAIVFVGLISGFRGYFQGKENMVPSAISGFIEQFVKMALGIIFASKLIVYGVGYGVLGAMIGISFSELFALIYLIIRYLLDLKHNKCVLRNQDLSVDNNKKTIKTILSLSVFVTLGGLIMPLTMLIDSTLVINILKSIGFSKVQATKLYGLQTGIVGAIINMPVVLSLGISTSILPCISRLKANSDEEGVKKTASKAIFLTILLSLPSSIGCMAFAEPIIRLLYSRSLTANEIMISSKILEVASIGIFYLAMTQVTAGILQGISKFFVPLISLSCGAVVKTILNVILLRIRSVNILGAEVATVVCYMVALIVNLSVLKHKNLIKLDFKILIIFLLSFLIYFSKYIFRLMVNNQINYYLSLFLVIFFVILIYFAVVFILYVFPKKRIIKHENEKS